MRGAGFMDVQFLLNAVNTVISVCYIYSIHSNGTCIYNMNREQCHEALISLLLCLFPQCRYVLQWTYAYGFYLQDGTPQKALFETFQVFDCLL